MIGDIPTDVIELANTSLLERLIMYCKYNECDYIKGYRLHGERRVKVAARMGVKCVAYDTFVSDYVFMHCRDIVDLMRRGLWAGDV